MVSIAGSKKLKRQMAPMFWGIGRKEKRFVVTVRPGSHPKNYAIPTAVLLRDVLKNVTTLREAKSVIYSGKIKVDGIQRKSLHHSIGLMDVVELEGYSDIFRLIPADGLILKPIKIEESEKTKKLCKVTSKTSIKNGKVQVGFHDGRSVITDTEVKVGDSCLIEIPKQKIIEIIKLEKGCQVIVTRGANVGQTGTVKEIQDGTFTLQKRVNISLGEREIEIPVDIVMVVGKDKPILKIR